MPAIEGMRPVADAALSKLNERSGTIGPCILETTRGTASSMLRPSVDHTPECTGYPDCGGRNPGGRTRHRRSPSVEALQRRYPCHDGFVRDACCVQLSDVRGTDNPLFFIGDENGRPVGGSNVWSLSIELSWIMNDREEDFEKLSISDFRRVINDFD